MRPRKPFSRALFLGQGVIREGLAVAILVRGSRARGSRAQGKQLFVDQVMSFFDELKAICVNADFWTSLGRCANPNLLLRLTRTLCESASNDVEVACILRQVRDLELARCNVGLHEIRSDGLDQLRFGLSYLDAQSVSRVRSMNKWWHKEASADAVWKPLGIAEWPSTKALHWNSLVKSGYISYFFRRRQLENSEGWKVEMSPCTPLAKDFGVIVELNAGERSVIHTYLDLSAHASQGVTAILDGQGHFPITWDELEALTLTVLLHRKADDKLLRLLVNAPSCGRDMMGILSRSILLRLFAFMRRRPLTCSCRPWAFCGMGTVVSFRWLRKITKCPEGWSSMLRHRRSQGHPPRDLCKSILWKFKLKRQAGTTSRPYTLQRCDFF